MKKFVLVVIVLCLFAGSVSADLRAWYKFDETSGADVADSSGNGFDTVISGTVNYGWDTAGAVGGCLDNNNTARKQWIDVPAGVFSTISTEVTFAWWVQKTPISTGGGWFCGYNTSDVEMIKSTPYSDGDTAIYRAGAASTNWWYGYGANSSVGEWDHFALVYDETAGIKRLYFNGEVVSDPGISAGDSMADIYDLKIFAGRFAPGSGLVDTWNCFHGKMDEFRIYDNALTQTEVQALIPEPTTVALLCFGAMALIKRKRS